ncbi:MULTISPECIES: response regulator transcription factor [Priestia]|jgi:DNA-binding response OmpR family regulator|uniref:response regulator transcription factor n=1 Tax=Priestia TaxID=2800373 RepID=UPI000BA5DC09|nr:response regulator transcription factor [Priestia megaterium]MBU8753495.1 response regulator transcription factor [Priestia megaterium]MCF8886845.1 response regulator transcription factor [Priestia megaterium]MDD1511681.1 response regulator transcription factor [Priestia megaterium]MDH3185661.1 response regulator transcription factor [Priestia megaterium]MDQ0806394.1 DNA-binding response OmpR family regulator [Priestia megaterium]
MQKVLIVEDEEGLVEFLELELKYEGYLVDVAYDGRTGLDKATKQDYDIILLDLMMPGLNGIEVCRRLRTTKNTPVIMLTAKDSVMDRVMGLDNGADDYLSKPFAIEELFARMRVIFRRQENNKILDQKRILAFKEIELDMESRIVIKEKNLIELTNKEFELLAIFMRNINKVLTRDILLEKVWGYDSVVETNVVDVYVRYLRNKLSAEDKELYIQTIRGVGYVMRDV